MTLPFRRPSAGFFLLCTSYLGLVVFLGWGFSQPELDRAWQIQQRMMLAGFSGLSPEEERTLSCLLERHPGLGRALIGDRVAGFVEPTEDGWLGLERPHLVIEPRPGTSLWLECRADPRDYPVRVTLDSPELKQQLEFLADGARQLEISATSASAPLWVSLLVEPSRPRTAGAAPRLRLLVGPPPGPAR